MRYALVGVAGRFAAFAILIVLALLGLGALLSASAMAFELVRWVGVGYLMWLGITTFRNAGRGAGRAVLDREPEYGMAARREFITALSNPKALLLFASFVPQFVPSGAPVTTFGVLAVVYTGVEAVVACGYIGVGRALRHGGDRFKTWHRKHLDRVAGASFLGFGGYLAMTRRP